MADALRVRAFGRDLSGLALGPRVGVAAGQGVKLTLGAALGALLKPLGIVFSILGLSWLGWTHLSDFAKALFGAK